MSTEPTIARIKTILEQQLGILEPEFITESSRFLDDLGADSLDAVEIVMAVEEEFQIEITDEEAGGLETVAELVALVDRKVTE